MCDILTQNISNKNAIETFFPANYCALLDKAIILRKSSTLQRNEIMVAFLQISQVHSKFEIELC